MTRTRFAFSTALAPGALLVAIACALSGCKKAKELPDLGEVPPFAMVDQAGKPFTNTYPQGATVGQALADALTHFSLVPEGDGAGNQIVFHLYRGGDRVDPSKPLRELAHGGHLQLRLVREVVAG